MDLSLASLEAQIMWDASNTRRWVDVTDTNARSAADWVRHLRASEERRAMKTRLRRLHQSRPSIHMPRWASRITLEVTDVRVERVCDISPSDARAEGIFADGECYTEPPLPYPVATFKRLWDSINEKRGFGWDENPWTWAVSFRLVTP